jgi:glutathione-regulated potassium-efflux system ancillary protein KefG
MPKLLILFAHPVLERSRVHIELIRAAQKVKGVTINDLYQRYPDFDIDIEREKQLLDTHNIVIWQHPFYWYSAPPLLRQWQDLVLEHGWAYGRNGTALRGKQLFNVVTTGAGADAYQAGGFNKYSIHEYLRPFERTAELCGMHYWPPFWIAGVHGMTKEHIRQYADQYLNLLHVLTRDVVSNNEVRKHVLLNDFISEATTYL